MIWKLQILYFLLLSFTLLRNLGNLLAIIIINNFFRCIKGCLLIISCKKIFPKILRFKKNLTNFSTNPNWKKKSRFQGTKIISQKIWKKSLARLLSLNYS